MNKRSRFFAVRNSESDAAQQADGAGRSPEAAPDLRLGILGDDILDNVFVGGVLQSQEHVGCGRLVGRLLSAVGGHDQVYRRDDGGLGRGRGGRMRTQKHERADDRDAGSSGGRRPEATSRTALHPLRKGLR